jgi:hypothetical protein
MTRYLLQRADGAFFRHPTDEDEQEWTDHPREAHQWVYSEAAEAAAFIWNNLKGEDVMVVPATFTPSGYELSVRR